MIQLKYSAYIFWEILCFVQFFCAYQLTMLLKKFTPNVSSSRQLLALDKYHEYVITNIKFISIRQLLVLVL